MTAKNRVHRTPRIADVQLEKMRVNSRAQRGLVKYHVERMAVAFDPDLFGFPTLSERGGWYYIIDGQQRIAALRLWLGDGWEEQYVKCEVYSGLTEAEEAELFLKLNRRRVRIRAIDDFKTAITAGHETERMVEHICHANSITIGDGKAPGRVGCVTTLKKVYTRSDGLTLGKALRIIRDAYGDSGLEAAIIDGVGHLCQRYNGTLDEEQAISKLRDVRGGLQGLLSRADIVKRQTGVQKPISIAAAAVEIINSGKGGKKIPGWW